MSRCDICLEETCGGKRNCNCETCTARNECPRFLHATIRITNMCTQKCSHCCFSSSPQSKLMMSVSKAKEIADFMEINDVMSINVMGGEFFCNPNWYEIFQIFGATVKHMRIVTNGDWHHNLAVRQKLARFVAFYKDKLRVSVSKDKWHTNTYADEAYQWLQEREVRCNITTGKEGADDTIVPVGRGELANSFGFYSFMGTYCTNPTNKYSFLIDEEGDIYKCGFGMWKYANVSEHLEGTFPERFKFFNKAFYNHFIPSCAACRRVNDGQEDSQVKRE